MSMSTPTRKQREIAERHQLFLTIAEDIVREENCHALSMDRIAELAEYSKGTVYQHFHCKEEILIQLCNQCMMNLASLFARASEFSGNHRERLLAVFYAHDLFFKLQPDSFELMQGLGGQLIMTKVNPDSLGEHRRIETSLIGTVSAIVADAIKDGELELDDAINPVELVFGLWSLSYGGQLIQTYDIPLQELGVRDPGASLIRTSLAMLDGLQWQPLSANFNYDQTLVRVQSEIFSEETRDLSQNQK